MPGERDPPEPRVSTGSFRALTDQVHRLETRQDKSEDDMREKLDIVVAGIGDLKVGVAEIKVSLTAHATNAAAHAAGDVREFDRVEKDMKAHTDNDEKEHKAITKQIDEVKASHEKHVEKTGKLSKLLYIGMGIAIAVSAAVPFLVEWIFRGHH